MDKALVKKLCLKGLEAIKAQEVRKRTKDINDEDVVSLCNKKIGEIDLVINHLMTKELFDESATPVRSK